MDPFDVAIELDETQHSPPHWRRDIASLEKQASRCRRSTSMRPKHPSLVINPTREAPVVDITAVKGVFGHSETLRNRRRRLGWVHRWVRGRALHYAVARAVGPTCITSPIVLARRKCRWPRPLRRARHDRRPCGPSRAFPA
jgi:hypothetical protein